MRAAGVLALVVAAGVGLATAGGTPGLRAVRAPAGGIEAPSGMLLAAAEFDGPARLMGRIEAGTWRQGRRPWQHVEPALAVSPSGRRAYVVAGDARLVAEIELRRWRVAYHDVSEPVSAMRRLLDLVERPAHAKEPVDSQARRAEVLPNGAIAVTGEDTRATDPPHGAPPIPFGVWLIDPRTWTVRAVDRDAQDFTVAGGFLLARRWSMAGGQRPIGVRAYDTAGARGWTRFEDADTIVRGAAGGRAYVEVKRSGRRSIHVLELDSGRTVRTLPWRERGPRPRCAPGRRPPRPEPPPPGSLRASSSRRAATGPARPVRASPRG